MKKILSNALGSLITSIAGSVAGVAEIHEGVATKDASKIIVGIGILIIGLLAKEK